MALIGWVIIPKKGKPSRLPLGSASLPFWGIKKTLRAVFGECGVLKGGGHECEPCAFLGSFLELVFFVAGHRPSHPLGDP